MPERLRGFVLRSGRAGAALDVAGAAVTGIALLLIALLTLWPSPSGSVSFTPPSCVFCTEQAAVDGMLNLLLFVPLGVGLSMLRLKAVGAALIALMVTVGVEMLQFLVVTGRDASLADIVANAAGGVIGIALGRFGGVLAGRAPRVARRLLIAGCLTWVVGMSVAAWAIAPRFHLGTTHVLERPLSQDGIQFRGRVLEAELGELRLSAGAALDGAEVRRRLLAGEEVRARIVVGELAHQPATILKLIAPPFGRELLWLGEHDGAVMWRVWQNGTVAHLAPAILRLESAGGALRPGDTIVVQGGVDRSSLRLRIAGRGGEARREIPLSPGASWSLVLPMGHGIGAWRPAADAAWLALLLFPLGYWGRIAGEAGERQARGARGLPIIVVGVSTVLGLAVVPALIGVAVVAWPGWLGALAGLLLGAGVAALAQRRVAKARVMVRDEDGAAAGVVRRVSASPP